MTAMAVGVLFAFTMNAFPAHLETNESVEGFLQSFSQASATQAADLTAPGIFGAERATARPVIYGLEKAPYSENRLLELAAVAGLSGSSGVRSEGESSLLEDSGKNARVGYDAQRGIYFYYSKTIEQEPLSKTDEASLEALKQKAQVVLEKVFGDNAANFVFANIETDWIKLKDSTSPTIAKQTYRFTRKLNGRHVVDNAAFFRATFAGAQELCVLEFADPVLEPMQVEVMVRPEATAERLGGWVQAKETATSPTGEKIQVEVVSARKPLETYLSISEGGRILLVPHVSFWSSFELANGDSYSRYVHLCMDAKRTANLEESMIEEIGR